MEQKATKEISESSVIRGGSTRPKKRGPSDDRTCQFSRHRMAEDETFPLSLDRIFESLTLADDRSIVLWFYVLFTSRLLALGIVQNCSFNADVLVIIFEASIYI